MIKKRVFRLFAVVLVLAMLSACAVGCTFIKENEERAANEAYVIINHNGITLTVTYNELMDYFNSMGYYYINYYGYSVGDTLDVCIRTKIQTKYLITDAMVYLTGDQVSQERKNVLVGGGSKVNPVDVLTIAERTAAIYTINESITSSLDSAKKDARQTDIGYAWKAVAADNVKGIKLSQETEEYFAKFFHDGEGCYVGDELDKEKVKIVVEYDNGTESAPVVVPNGQYSTEFSSSAADNYSERTEDKTFTIKFNENVTDSDGNVTAEEHTFDYKYKLVYPRTTKTKTEDETLNNEIAIGDYKHISRYAKLEEIPADVLAKAQKRDLEQEYADAQKSGSDKYLIEAYRITLENLKKASKSMDYLYNSQFESAVLNAMQAEKYIAADKVFNTASDAQKDAMVAKEFRYLYNNAKNSYVGDQDKDKSTFLGAIKEGVDTLYYYPVVEDIDKYYYVSQILFAFTPEMKDFLSSLDKDKDSIAEFAEKFLEEELTTLRSNPDFDSEKYDPLTSPKEDEPFQGTYEVAVVMETLESELNVIYNDASLSADEKAKKATETFDRYLYMYNDDPGIFNKDYGYLMTAEDKDSGWVEAFNELGHAIFDYNNVALGGSGKVGNAFDAAGHLAYSCSDYGVHLMMINATPFAAAPAFDINDDASVVAYLKTRFNPNTGKTLYETLLEGLKKENRTSVYNDFVGADVPENLFERNADKKNKLTSDKKELKKLGIEINLKKIKKEIYDVYLGK